MNDLNASLPATQQVFFAPPIENSALDQLLGVGVDPASLVTSDNSYLTNAEFGDGEAGDGWDIPDWYDDEMYEYERGIADEAAFQEELRQLTRVPAEIKIVPRDITVPYVKKPISSKLRWKVFQRDDYQCLRCGSRSDLTADHIYAEVHGGPTTMDNLQTLCRSCNSKKGAR